MLHIKSEVVDRVNQGVEGLRSALQTAICLEHATIPVYLYALYSIKPGSNKDIAKLICSIVHEEMLHMALVCNVLNAIGGSPEIRGPQFVPKYPGPLPGSVEDGLVVGLRALSKQHVQQVFMVIEEPDRQRDGSVTVGDFYRKIQKSLRTLRPCDFSGDPQRQVRTGFSPLQVIDVRDANSAVEAIELVVEQGEGTQASPIDPEGDLAHYFKFAEIYYGREYVPDQSGKFGFTGTKIDFDPCGVWPAIADPASSSYKIGSKVHALNDEFNRTYTRLLRWLHCVFNGYPDRLAPSIYMMRQLKEQAELLMSCEIVPGMTAGPTFEYKR
jgi:hypothetical protein